eukprot:SAG31_NODE_29723_length_390_cov_12.096220_1_plen_129_part_11
MAGKKITGKLGEYEIVDDVPLGQGAEAAVYRGAEELVRLQLAYRLALAKGLHSRLGHDSPVDVLSTDTVRQILQADVLRRRRREIAVKVQNQPQLPASHTVIRRQGPRGSGHLEPIGIRIDASAARSSA